MKYVFKESELKAALKQIIAEEISRIDEGFGKKLLHGLGKVALGAAKTAILPDHMLGKAVDKIAFKPFKGELPIGHGSSSSNGLGNSSQRKSLGNEEVLDNIMIKMV